MNGSLLVDVIIVLAIIVRAMVGARNGFVAGLLSLLGVASGAAAGIWAGLRLVDLIPTPETSRALRTATLIVVVIAGIALGEAIFGALTRRIRGEGRARGWMPSSGAWPPHLSSGCSPGSC